MITPFTKMEGLGNDFIFIDQTSRQEAIPASYDNLAIRLCDRKFGIGADGLIIISDSSTCNLKFNIFNSDGSEAQMCGNGMRCFAMYAHLKRLTTKTSFTVETLAGTIIPHIIRDNTGTIKSVRVDMGEPITNAAKVPFLSKNNPAISEKVEIEGNTVEITAVSMGNPHAIIIVPDVEKAPVISLGPVIETCSLFPEKTNVEFIEVISDSELKMKVWERGAGVTLACGTGACAAVVAAILNGKTKNRVTIHLDGGPLDIEWDRKNNHIYKSGPATLVFEGTVTV